MHQEPPAKRTAPQDMRRDEPQDSSSGYVADGAVLRAAVTYCSRHWKSLLGFAVVGGLLAFAGSFLVEPVYRADLRASLVVDSDKIDLASAGGALGGLASLAGVQSRESNERVEAMAVLASRTLGEQFIVAENLMPALFPTHWDSTNNKWIPKRGKDSPSIREAFKGFVRRVRVIDTDPKTGLVIVGMYWADPDDAARLTNRYVDLANRILRERAISEARASLGYLEAESEKTQSVALREAMYRLVEQQMKKIVLGNIRPDYAFKIIDPAVAPDADDLARPRRLLMAGIGLFLGLSLGIVASLFRGAR